jgi:uncharacterized protein (DUF302 family)
VAEIVCAWGFFNHQQGLKGAIGAFIPKLCSLCDALVLYENRLMKNFTDKYHPFNLGSIMYHFSTRLQGDIKLIEQQLIEALQAEGFGILSEIDVQATLKKKLDVDGRYYKILGACNPPLAHQALTDEPDIGLLLPCNVVIREEEDKSVVVAFMDPAAVFTLVERDDVAPLAKEVKSRLERVRESLGGDFIN